MDFYYTHHCSHPLNQTCTAIANIETAVPSPLQVHPVGRTCDVGLDIPGVALPDDFKKLTATLQRPRSNKEEPVNLELNPDNTLGMSRILFHSCEKIWVTFSNLGLIDLNILSS